MTTSIQWTDETWNPVRGCALVSAGCENCYAMKQAHRFSGAGMPYEGLTVLGKHGPRWTGRARFIPHKLNQPLSWKKPRKIFVNSMSDPFHEDITNEEIAAIFGVMAACHWHTFQVLTKRIDRALSWFDWLSEERNPNGSWPLTGDVLHRYASKYTMRSIPKLKESQYWMPLSNVWFGVSAEDQKSANERIGKLIQIPAAVHFVSAEPLLEEIKFAAVPGLNLTGQAGQDILRKLWIIAGGESGPDARPCDVAWILSIIEQCKRAGVPCFVKQCGSNAYNSTMAWKMVDRKYVPTVEQARQLASYRFEDGKGGDMNAWPQELRVQEWPRR